MDQLEYDHTIFNAQQSEADKNLLVRFYPLPLRNDDKSLEAGRPIFDSTDMIEIRVRGNKDNVVVRPLREDDKMRFRDAWRAYKDNAKLIESGTPLSQWPLMSSAQVEELKFLGFFTIEQLVNASDSVVASVPMLAMLKNKAKTFLEFCKGAAPMEKLQEDLAAVSNEKEVLARQLKEAVARLEVLEQAAATVADKPAKSR